MARKLDLSKLKSKVAQLKGDNKTSVRKSIFWSAPLPKGQKSAEYEVFMVPWPDLEDYPFKEKWFYYELGNMKDSTGNSLKDENGRFIKAPLTLKQFGEADPVDDLIRKLWDKEGKEKEEAKNDQEAAKKLFSSQTVYVPVIIKGEEALGVRLWKFSSKKVYERLIELFMKDKVGDLNDPSNDIWISIKVEEEPSKKWPMNKKIGSIDLELLDRRPLSEDQEQIDKWVSEVPDLDEALKFQKYTSEGLRKLLVMWADSGDGEVDPSEGTEGAKEKEAPEEDKKRSRPKKKKEEEKSDPKSKAEAMKKLEGFLDDDDDDDDES